MSTATLACERWDAAPYTKNIGTDLANNDRFVELCESCHSDEAACATIEDQFGRAFKRLSRANSAEWQKVRGKVKAVAAHVFKLVCSDSKGLPDSQSVVVAIAILVAATQGTREWYQVLFHVFSKLENNLDRSSARLEQVNSGQIAADILVEVLAILALALSSINAEHFTVISTKCRRASNWFRVEHPRRFIVESGESSNALLRLDRLTVREETGMSTTRVSQKWAEAMSNHRRT